jgi:PAS domain S-box-containing protein
MMDTQGFITSWNVGAEKVKGYKADEIAGKHFSCFYTDEDIDKGLPHQVLQATLEHGQHEEEGWRMRKDGSHIWANTVTHALRNDRGDVVGMFRITRDITGRKMAEDALASQAHRQSTTSTLTLSALTGIDIDTLMNQSVSLLAQTLNVPFATVLELLPDGSEMLLKAGVGWPPGYVGTITITADQNSQAGYTLVVEEPVVVDDLRRETRFSPSPFLLNNGIISGISVIIQGREKPYGVLGVHSNQYRRFSEEDVNFLQSVANILGIALERKRIEIELEEAKEGAQEASQKKSQFLANMSHELRTPLNSIIGYGEMLEGGYAGQMNDRQQRYIHNMVVSGHRLLNMVNDILDLSQSETGEITLNTRTFHVMPFMDEVKEQMQPMADSKKVYLAFHIQPELEVIEADPVRLRQIMLNLISNAIKFNHEGGEVNVRMGTSPDEEWIECEVIDTGIGIPREKIDSMFQEFYQVDASIARREEGTGLGLAITRRLVELHGGSIQVESIEGQGSTFSFRIPAFAHARIQKDIREQAS